MLNNSAREFLLQVKREKGSFVLDGLYFCGWAHGQIFSFEDAYEYLSFFGASKKLVRAGLNDPLFNRQGRRNARYTLPSPEHVLSTLNIQEGPFKDVLTGAAFASVTAYRLALHVALIARAEGSYSRKLLSQRLGVSRVTSLNYQKKYNAAGLETKISAEPQYRYTRLTHQNIGALPLGKPAKAGNMWLERRFAPNQQEDKAPLERSIARRWIADGYEVYLTKQLTNYYQLVPAWSF